MLKEVEAAFEAQLAKLGRQEHLREVAEQTTHLILVRNLRRGRETGQRLRARAPGDRRRR